MDEPMVIYYPERKPLLRQWWFYLLLVAMLIAGGVTLLIRSGWQLPGLNTGRYSYIENTVTHNRFGNGYYSDPGSHEPTTVTLTAISEVEATVTWIYDKDSFQESFVGRWEKEVTKRELPDSFVISVIPKDVSAPNEALECGIEIVGQAVQEMRREPTNTVSCIAIRKSR